MLGERGPEEIPTRRHRKPHDREMPLASRALQVTIEIVQESGAELLAESGREEAHKRA